MGIRFDWLTGGNKPRDFIPPRRFDRNMIVIGGGSAGLVTSYLAAALKSEVTLIEREKMGGDCLYTGCVPSKTLLRTAKFLHDVKRSKDFGVRVATADFDFAQVMDRVRSVIATIEPHDSPARYESLGVECMKGTARLVDPWTVEVGDQRLTARSIVLATGGRPAMPPIDGLDSIDALTSNSLWSLSEQPKRLLILGGGPIGCEMAQAFARLGTEVTLIERAKRILSKEDEDAAAVVSASLIADGAKILTGHTAKRFEHEKCICEADSGDVAIPFDRVLVAVGRSANSDGLGLDSLGIETERGGTIKVNQYLQTAWPHILALGDAIAPYQFTHSASHEAYYVATNGLFGHLYAQAVDYSVLPWVTFTDPELAHVGENEQSATEKNMAFETHRFDFQRSDRALTEADANGFVKVLTSPGKDNILGATIVGPHAGELIAEIALSKKHGLGLSGIMSTVHAYPTLAEANKFVAGEWRRSNQPGWALKWLQRFHQWRRG